MCSFVLLVVIRCSSCRIFWYSKQFEGKTSQREPWYGTDYIIERAEDSLVQVQSWASHNDVQSWAFVLSVILFYFDSILVSRLIYSN